MRKVRVLSRLAPLAALLSCASVLAGASPKPQPPPGEAGGCARVQKALENVVTTPGHSYTTETSSQRGTTQTESIYLDGKVYILMSGRWILSPVTAMERVAELRRNAKHATLSCKVLGEEKVEDRTAAVYLATRSAGDSQSASKLWIDQVSGLLLRQEEDLTGGDQKVHRSIRYEYGSVKAPKLAD